MRYLRPVSPEPNVGCDTTGLHPNGYVATPERFLVRRSDEYFEIRFQAALERLGCENEDDCDPDLVERAREETRPIEDQWAGEYSAFSDGLLVDELREFARESIPTSVAGLARAASVSFEDSELATAFADLCVTGRNAFERFRTERPTVERIVEELRSIRAGTDEDLEAAAEWALHRTLVVANALRTGVGRESLGWIAVCGDEDPPHRPVNVPVTEYPQFDLDVRVEPIALRNQTVRTRAMIAIGEPTEIEPPASDTLGDDPTPTIDPDIPLVLFLHGHSSRLEEAESLIRPFVRRGFGVVAMDLPSSGYSESIPHDRIEEEIPEPLITDNPPRYFALEFLDAFVHAFINALSDAVGFDISRQVVLVIGGSLGGNLSLRLASASPFNKPYAANVSAWSPASVWTPSDDNFWRNLGPKTSAERAWEHEDESTRESYFYYTFFAANPAFDLRPQGEYWYRDGWEPCKSLHITGAIADRQEIYNESFRRWHWRVAMEQLWFSHNEPAFRRHNILGRTLLSAGEKDNYNWSHIHNATQTLAIRLLNAPGKFYSIKDTGHSIHVERPEFFAREMALFAPPLYPGDETETWSAPVSLGGVSNSDPVAVKQENGRLVVFSINASNRVQFAVQADSGFGSWSTISGGLGSGDSFLAPFDVAINHGGHLEVFATLSNEPWLAHVWQDGANGPWRDWEKGNHVSQLIGSATSGVRVAERVGHGDGPERLLLACARLTDGRVHVRGQNVLDSWWMNGKNLGEDSVTLIGRPCIAANKRQLLHLFIRDSSNSIQHIWEEAQDNWADSWTAMFSATSDPVCAIDATGRLHVFARGDTGDLTLQSEASTGSRSIRGDWTSAPISLGGTIAAGTSPAVARNAWGQLQVFATFDDRTIRTRRQLSGDSSVWSEWFDTGLITNGNPTVVSNLDGTLSVFALATDGSITWARQENPYVEPALERLITGVTKNEDDEIIAVCNPGEPWSPLSTAEVVRDILSGAHVYFTEVDGIRANVHVVEGRYLRSNPDGTTINNLDELPEC